MEYLETTLMNMKPSAYLLCATWVRCFMDAYFLGEVDIVARNLKYYSFLIQLKHLALEKIQPTQHKRQIQKHEEKTLIFLADGVNLFYKY